MVKTNQFSGSDFITVISRTTKLREDTDDVMKISDNQFITRYKQYF